MYFGMVFIFIILICFLSFLSCFIVFFFGCVVSIWFLYDYDLSIKFWVDGVLCIFIWLGKRVNVCMVNC